jgi:hypothetical protein
MDAEVANARSGDRVEDPRYDRDSREFSRLDTHANWSVGGAARSRPVVGLMGLIG